MRPAGVACALTMALGLATFSGVSTTAAGAVDIPAPQVAPGAAGAPFTPLTSQLLEPPAPLKGSDGRRHLAFEFLVTNLSPRQASITGVTVRVGSSPKVVLEQLNQEGVTANMIPVGDLSLTRTSIIPSHSTNALVLDGILPQDVTTPSRLAVTLTATFQPPSPGQPSYVSIFPDAATEQLPPVPVSKTKPVIIRPPLSGGDWVSTNACCQLSPHRGVLLGGAGLPVAPERYGIDFLRIDSKGDLYQPGSPQSMSNNYSYGAKLLAVAPATVVAIQDGLPDQPPGVNPSGYSLNQLGGNYVVLKLGAHTYALYAHIAPHTIKVKVGQRLRAGQTIGLLGNSGNSTAPHLHFQLMNGPGLLTSQGVPYEFPGFQVLAVPSPEGTFAPINPPRTLDDAYPLTNSVITFLGSTSAPVSPSPEPSDGAQPGT